MFIQQRVAGGGNIYSCSGMATARPHPEAAPYQRGMYLAAQQTNLYFAVDLAAALA
jgi:hypothetical protein